MRTSLLLALLAATAAVPVALPAQEYNHGHDRGGQNGGQGQRGHGPAQAAAPQAPQQQAQPQPQQQPQRSQGAGRGGDRGVVSQGQPQQQRGPGGYGARGGYNRGGDSARGYGQPNQQAQAAGQREAGRPDDRGPNRPDFRGDPRGARPGYEAGNRFEGQGYQRNRQDWRDNGRAQQAFGERRDWNRNWRQDRRYDYGAFRARNRDNFHLPRYYAPYGWNYGYRRFSVGFRLSSVLFEQNYWIDDGAYYGLPPAYGPYRWVRYYNDALLVDIYSGEVVDTVYDIFW